jgi:hypothetical protein
VLASDADARLPSWLLSHSTGGDGRLDRLGVFILVGRTLGKSIRPDVLRAADDRVSGEASAQSCGGFAVRSRDAV